MSDYQNRLIEALETRKEVYKYGDSVHSYSRDYFRGLMAGVDAAITIIKAFPDRKEEKST